MSDEINPVQPAKTLALNTDAISKILALVNFPQKYRGLIDILIGISGGSIEVVISDADLSSRVRNVQQQADEEAAKGWLKLNRRKFITWQEENNLPLIEYKQGYKDKSGTPHKSRYTLHILKLADEVVKEANITNQNTFTPAAIEEAANKVVSKFMTEHKSVIKRRTNTKPINAQIKQQLLTAAGNMKRALDLVEKNYSEISDDLKDPFLQIEFLLTDLRIYIIPEEEN
jgi:hypothetical protein